MLHNGKRYFEVEVGQSFDWSITITECHLVQGAGLIGDFNPLHVDEGFASKSRFGGRILHGMTTSALMGGPLGMIFAGSAIAYLEHNVRFISAARPGDTLTTIWTISEKVDKPHINAGVVSAHGICVNQKGEKVAESNDKLLIGNEYGAK